MRSFVFGALACFALAACGDKTDTSAIAGNGPDAPKAAPKETSGPFGISAGTKLADLKTEAADATTGLHYVTRIPRSHPDIERVLVQAFPETGVCFIKGITYEQQNDGTGASTKALADRLAEQLSIKYGKSDKVDRCNGGLCATGYGDPTHWAMDIMNGEQTYAYAWEDVPENAEGVSKVYLAAQATNLASPYVVIEYYLRNEPQCAAIAKQKGASAL